MLPCPEFSAEIMRVATGINWILLRSDDTFIVVQTRASPPYGRARYGNTTQTNHTLTAVRPRVKLFIYDVMIISKVCGGMWMPVSAELFSCNVIVM